MISTETLAPDIVAATLALLGGYLVGSIPLAGRIARAAGQLPLGAGEPQPGIPEVWRVAGPGWGLLALTGDLAKGVIPVAIGVVTWSWWIGWAAGLGALLGTRRPAFGRLPGGSGVAVLGGVAFTLAPAAGAMSVLLAGLVLVIGRLAGRDVRVPAMVVGFGVFALLVLAIQQDAARVCAILVLYAVAAVRARATHDR